MNIRYIVTQFFCESAMQPLSIFFPKVGPWKKLLSCQKNRIPMDGTLKRKKRTYCSPVDNNCVQSCVFLCKFVSVNPQPIVNFFNTNRKPHIAIDWSLIININRLIDID